VAYYLARDVRELDRLAIEEHHIPGFTLMQRAGAAAYQAILERWPDTRRLLCFCGSGNNGGDGYVIAALAREHDRQAVVIAVGKPQNLQGDARLAYDMAQRQGVMVQAFDPGLSPTELASPGTVIVDAMLGTGLTGDVRGDYLAAITLVNDSGCPVAAVDIPSGLCSDTGRILGLAVKADLTVTFIGRKLGMIENAGPGCCGDIVFDNLDVPREIYRRVTPAG